jgi:hypothetical protein
LECKTNDREAAKRLEAIHARTRKLADEINDLDATIVAAQKRLADATRTAHDEAEKENQKRCAAIVLKATKAAEDMHMHLKNAAEAAGQYRASMMRLQAQAPRLIPVVRPLLTANAFTLDARAAGLAQFIDMPPAFTGEKCTAVAEMVRAALGRYLDLSAENGGDTAGKED